MVTRTEADAHDKTQLPMAQMTLSTDFNTLQSLKRSQFNPLANAHTYSKQSNGLKNMFFCK